MSASTSILKTSFSPSKSFENLNNINYNEDNKDNDEDARSQCSTTGAKKKNRARGRKSRNKNTSANVFEQQQKVKERQVTLNQFTDNYNTKKKLKEQQPKNEIDELLESLPNVPSVDEQTLNVVKSMENEIEERLRNLNVKSVGNISKSPIVFIPQSLGNKSNITTKQNPTSIQQQKLKQQKNLGNNAGGSYIKLLNNNEPNSDRQQNSKNTPRSKHFYDKNKDNAINQKNAGPKGNTKGKQNQKQTVTTKAQSPGISKTARNLNMQQQKKQRFPLDSGEVMQTLLSNINTQRPQSFATPRQYQNIATAQHFSTMQSCPPVYPIQPLQQQPSYPTQLQQTQLSNQTKVQQPQSSYPQQQYSVSPQETELVDQRHRQFRKQQLAHMNQKKQGNQQHQNDNCVIA